MRASLRVAGVAAGAALLFGGCVTREDIRGIQKDLYTIQSGIETRLGNVKNQTESVQTSQADLLQQMRELSEDLSGLKAELQDNQQKMSSLQGRLDDLEASLVARIDSQIELLSGSKYVEKPSPSTLYNLANSDFARGKYSEAIKGFQSFVKQFPKAEKAAEAKLKIGDAYVKQREYASAIDAYEQLVQDHPKDSLVPSALLKKGSVLEQSGRKSQAKDIYSSILKSHPYGAEARAAQERLRALQADGK